MVLGWTYFLILQSIVLLTYYLFRKKSDENDFNLLFPSKIHFVISNLSLFLICIQFNSERQLFCRPVTWTSIVLILFGISFLIIPFVNRKSNLLNIITSICGLGFFVSIYVIIFARLEYLGFIVFNIPFIIVSHLILRFIKRRFKTNVFDSFYFYSAIVITPFLLYYQLLMILRNVKTKTQKFLFIGTPILTFIIFLLLTLQIKSIIQRISSSNDKEKVLKEITINPVNNYLTELVLGAHWKYHTELCLLDGWRPPFHNPILVFSKDILYPFEPFVHFDKSIYLYKKMYPKNPTQFDCKCASHERLFE